MAASAQGQATALTPRSLALYGCSSGVHWQDSDYTSVTDAPSMTALVSLR